MSLHYNRENVSLFVDGTEIINYESKIPGIIIQRPLCSGNISVDNMKKLDLMDMLMILVLIMMVLYLMIFYTFINI